jgi:alkanesulfonate monooxygenase SsuD/methylene tetrahydromethanopterin reductase-like flavin-dependent oxidoreductase (luciferase family)
VTPGGPPIWIGGTGGRAITLAAKVADAWNGWGLGLDGFLDRTARLRDAAAEHRREVPPTWAGLALIGRDEAELRRLRTERDERGAPGAGVWQGTAEAFTAELRAIAAAGATWAIVMPAGPADRAGVIAEAAREAGVVER